MCVVAVCVISAVILMINAVWSSNPPTLRLSTCWQAGQWINAPQHHPPKPCTCSVDRIRPAVQPSGCFLHMLHISKVWACPDQTIVSGKSAVIFCVKFLCYIHFMYKTTTEWWDFTDQSLLCFIFDVLFLNSFLFFLAGILLFLMFIFCYLCSLGTLILTFYTFLSSPWDFRDK